eukprot:CAMPEP_0196599560 /NCGR_PEP_ID=MMETSP1081-20130531/94925_1 /TAXON_ID=36882 /ORGANISM="Pyramimonas amylifera, Strain CCMP720" /LENGTH=62 /DNA_ID=CAMNT_0041925343 /DNA_START=1452 /DNA_END=1640 /DNA_ORIENTATION=+
MIQLACHMVLAGHKAVPGFERSSQPVGLTLGTDLLLHLAQMAHQVRQLAPLVECGLYYPVSE